MKVSGGSLPVSVFSGKLKTDAVEIARDFDKINISQYNSWAAQGGI